MIRRLKQWAYRLAMLLLVSVLAMGLAYSFPADLALLFAADLSVYVEAVVMVFVAAQVAKVRPMLSMARVWLSAAYGRARGRTSLRSGATRPERTKAANDDEDGALALVA